LQLDAFVKLALCERLRTGHHFLYGGSNQHKLRYKQHTDLGGRGSDKYRHHTGDIRVHIGERFNEHEPDDDDHLHADSNQCRWFDHV
jgi:hypothetical protein